MPNHKALRVTTKKGEIYEKAKIFLQFIEQKKNPESKICHVKRMRENLWSFWNQTQIIRRRLNKFGVKVLLFIIYDQILTLTQ